MFQLSQEEQGGGVQGVGGYRVEQDGKETCTLYIHTGIGYISTGYIGICTVHSVLGRWYNTFIRVYRVYQYMVYQYMYCTVQNYTVYWVDG